MPADLIVYGAPCATVFLLRPVTSVGRDWIDDNVEVVTRFGNGVAVEHRYIEDLTEGAKADGLTIAWRPA